MRKLIALLVLVILVGLYGLSSKPEFMEKIADIRFRMNYFSPDAKYGDLYRFSHYPQQKSAVPKFVLKTFARKPSNLNLYITCDSYLGLLKSAWFPDTLKATHFKHLNTLAFYWRGSERGKLDLDTSQKNILILEFVERSVRANFADSLNFFKEHNNLEIQLGNHNKALAIKKQAQTQTLFDILFYKKINQNLEYNLFNYPVFQIFKEWKSYIDTKYFAKENEVVVSSDQKYLFLKSTVVEEFSESSFKPLSDEEVEKIVHTINAIYDTYKKKGFDEVYLSIIPNPVSIIEPTRAKYNQLISKIQNHQGLRMPYIDSYTPMKNTKIPIFQYSDTHWNSNGVQLWIDEVNKRLEKITQ